MAQGLVCAFCFHELVRVTCELIASESNYVEDLWQAMERYRSEI